MAKTIVLSKEKQRILKTLYYLGVELILVREKDGAIIITRSLKSGLYGVTLGKRHVSDDEIDENYLFPELLQLESYSSIVLEDLIAKHCPDV